MEERFDHTRAVHEKSKALLSAGPRAAIPFYNLLSKATGYNRPMILDHLKVLREQGHLIFNSSADSWGLPRSTDTQQEHSDMADAVTAAGLRRILLDEINDLRSNKSNPGRAKAVAALAKEMLESVRVEMEFATLTQRQGSRLQGVEQIGEMPIAR